MAETAAELIVDVTAKESVSAVLSRLETQLDKTNTSVEKIAAGMGARLGDAQQKAARDALSHAQAQARLQATSGNLAGGIRTLQAAIEQIARPAPRRLFALKPSWCRCKASWRKS